MKSITIERLTCDCVPFAGSRICYILTPMRLNKNWLEQWSGRYNTAIVSICGMDWDNDLTPWTAPGTEDGDTDFKGNASDFLSFLRTAVIPHVEAGLNMLSSVERTLIGISLSGLFALWAWMNGNDFIHIGCISGSFWYDGFTGWLEHIPIPHKEGCAYFSLGNKEGMNGNPRFSTVATDTASVVQTLCTARIPTMFEATSGTHFAPVYPCIEKAFDGLTLLATSEKAEKLRERHAESLPHGI